MTLMTQQREMGKVTATRRRETTVRMKEVRPEASSQSNIVNVRYREQCSVSNVTILRVSGAVGMRARGLGRAQQRISPHPTWSVIIHSHRLPLEEGTLLLNWRSWRTC